MLRKSELGQLSSKYNLSYKPAPGNSNIFWISLKQTNLTEVIIKKAVWKLKDQEKAFQKLKSKLINPLILKQADGMKPFIIRADASNIAIEAVLF